MIRFSALDTWSSIRLIDFVIGCFKFLLFLTLLGLFIVHHSVINLLLRNENLKLKYFMWSISWTARLALRVLNVKVSLVGVRGEVQKRLIVANHLSYLDVLILFSSFPSLFVTSVEIRETFLLGKVCKLAGCFFVERRKALRTPETKLKELSQMQNKLESGFNVFLFPEGTSSDGTSVLPFKMTFFQLALDTGSKVQPVTLKYQGPSKNVPPWYGDMTFADHLMRLCCERQINASLTIHDPVTGQERAELSQKCHTIIKECYDKG